MDGKEIRNFKSRVNEYLDVLRETPLIGKKPGKQKHLYLRLIIKQVSLMYIVSVVKKEIELVLFIDNRQNPNKIKKYKA